MDLRQELALRHPLVQFPLTISLPGSPVLECLLCSSKQGLRIHYLILSTLHCDHCPAPRHDSP